MFLPSMQPLLLTSVRMNAEALLLIDQREHMLTHMKLDYLDSLSNTSSQHDVQKVIEKNSTYIQNFVEFLEQSCKLKLVEILDKCLEILNKSWAVPTHGYIVGTSLCNDLRTSGGLNLLMENHTNIDAELQQLLATAKLLEQCLTTENRAYVVTHGLDKLVNLACACMKKSNNVELSRVGSGILEHLFKHSKKTCSDVMRLGGLVALLLECEKKDVETLRHCARALANLSLYGGAEIQEAVIQRKVPIWLFSLASHNDKYIKYYSCIAISVLAANAEIEAEVLQSGILSLTESFITTHNPSDLAKSNLAFGQSKTWLQHMVPILSSEREEAVNLAAFHFCMEAEIKKQQGNTRIFKDIGAIESLRKVDIGRNLVGSKYAAAALWFIAESDPLDGHSCWQLNQKVPLWSVEEVKEWVKRIGFTKYAGSFIESRVDGDLLLQLNEENLKDDIGLSNGIIRKRFLRELQKLKQIADYRTRDVDDINTFLQSMDSEFRMYTYSMLNAGDGLKYILIKLTDYPSAE